MGVADLSDPAAVRQAVAEFDELGRDEFLDKYGFGRAHRYHLVVEGRQYDAKAIIGAAHGYQFPDQGPLRSSDFASSERTVRNTLERLGCDVIARGETSPPESGDQSMWMVRAGEEAKHADEFEREGVAALGFRRVGDLTGLSRRDELEEALRRAEPNSPPRRRINLATVLDMFVNQIKEGDLVVTPKPNGELLIGQIISGYRYAPDPTIANYQNERSVEWLGRIGRSDLPEEVRKGLNGRQSTYWLGNRNDSNHPNWPLFEAADALMQSSQDPFALPKWTNAWWVNQGATFKQESEGDYVWAPNMSKGGGAARKHWQALTRMQVGDLIISYANRAIQAVSRVSSPAEVTDRPSELPLTEWEAKGWKVSTRYYLLDNPIALNEIPLEWRTAENGPFDVNGSVKQQYANHLSEHFTKLMIDRFGDRLGRTENGEDMVEVDARLIDLIQRRKNVVLYGPPGTGKTRQAFAIADRWEGEHGTGTVMKTTFHPSYGYEDFVQGFRPRKDDPAKFFLQPGVLLQACEAAKSRDVLLIIDEINRGDVARILGELITFIEADKRGPNHEFSLAQEPGERYFIPEGLHFLGTMNTADKSVSLLDVALRRRFAFVEFGPDPDVFGSNDMVRSIEGIDLAQILRTINGRLLSEGIEPDRAVGHALLLIDRVATDPVHELRERMEYDIAPLIMEYSYLERDRVRRVLGGLVDPQGHFRRDVSRSEFISLMRALASGAPPPTVEEAEPSAAALMEAEAFAVDQEEEPEQA